MRVLIAEDDSVSRTVLESILRKNNYEVLVTENGLEAFEAMCQPDAPAIAILDWMMPHMTGIEVVQKIRKECRDCPPYIIMLTSRNDAKSLVQGLESGADDYLAKPYGSEELLARIRVGERMLQMQNTLATHAREMETLAEARAKQLIHADRMSTLGVLSASMAHEINNPVTFISGNTQTIKRVWNILMENLKNRNALPEDDPQITFILEETPAMLEGILKGVNRITQIVKGLKLYAHRGSGEKTPCLIQDILKNALEFCRNIIQPHMEIHVDIPENLPEIFAHPQQIEQVFINLITNAIHAMGKAPSGEILIKACEQENSIQVEIKDRGPGIPADVLPKIFQPFFTTKKAGDGTGLGLAIIKDILEEHDGGLHAANAVEGGAVFTFHLPLNLPHRRSPST
ncbi:sensor histidine kinase [Desulfobotulus mexicanus]|uniref:histidine kinase n=1 Tax=Desulfobotulus mexicanus TaxID=2586642 RepID=A0A5S5ME70_9BACT|nr:ATP-binding protein [Desulfobotulus mexicanus]TYT74012.1 response regulator [Desulfobotulus mexicanus]